jgi:murein DD-endopeptidase MepM/ murein hydrolase activator NlpD
LLSRPISGPNGRQVDPTYRYASTNGGKRVPHTGVEFQAPEGEPVYAAGDGTVVQAGAALVAPFTSLGTEYGNLVIIRHAFDAYPEPVYSMYGHLSQVAVQIGQAVKAGDEIGRVGDTGAATGPHLHFEVRVGNEPLPGTCNPELWLKPASADDLHPSGAIAGRIASPDGSPLLSLTVSLQRDAAAGEPPPGPVYLETYDTDRLPGDDMWHEDFAAGDLPSGTYRVSVIANGGMNTRTVQILPDRVTVVTFDNDPLPNQSSGE